MEQFHDLVELWDETADVEVLIASYLVKKMSKELPPTGNAPTLQEAVDDSKRVEWDTLIEKGAIRFHFGKDAERIGKNHPNRFIGSRHVTLESQHRKMDRSTQTIRPLTDLNLAGAFRVTWIQT